MAVMIYVSVPLSLRHIEDLTHERRIDLRHEIVTATQARNLGKPYVFQVIRDMSKGVYSDNAIGKAMVQSGDIPSNTFHALDEVLSNEFWVEVEQYNELLNRDSGEPSVSKSSPICVAKPPSIR